MPTKASYTPGAEGIEHVDIVSVAEWNWKWAHDVWIGLK
jgi:hypothetical protein